MSSTRSVPSKRALNGMRVYYTSRRSWRTDLGGRLWTSPCLSSLTAVGPLSSSIYITIYHNTTVWRCSALTHLALFPSGTPVLSQDTCPGRPHVSQMPRVARTSRPRLTASTPTCNGLSYLPFGSFSGHRRRLNLVWF